MSKSRKMMIALGLALVFAPITASSSNVIVDEVMEEVSITRTIENEVIEVDFESTVAEMHKEQLKIEKELYKKEEAKKEYIEVDCEITFYTSLLCENTKYGAVDAQSNPLKWGTIAIPRDYELGTKFEFDGISGTFTGTDRGSKKHIKIKSNGVVRVDMFVPRNKGESDDNYYRRVNSYGRFKTKGRILIEQDIE